MTTEDLRMPASNASTPRIEKEFVHKNFDENVFVSNIEEVSERVFKVEGSLPKNHILYNDQVSGLSACSYFIELSRQSNIAICHLFFNIAFDANFTLISVDWNFSDNQPFLPKNFDPIIYNVEFKTYKVREKFSIVKIVGHLYQKGDNFLNGKSTFLFGNRGIDDNMNSIKLQPFIPKKRAVNPERVQIKNMENALITKPKYDIKTGVINAQMIVDPKHEYFFEHPCTHVPGMMLFEAGKQLIIGGCKTKFDFLKDTYGDLKEGKVAFSSFASPHTEISIEVNAQKPEVQSDCAHIPISVIYFQNNQHLGSIECIASFMDAKEVKKKSVYTSWIY